MWKSQNKEQPQMWSTHDLACAHCRARKIRCGRERPQCESCKRDGVECRYSSPGKRVNHVKLLCQNFEALEEQLNSIQGDLSTLTSLVKTGSVGKPIPERKVEWTFDDFSRRKEPFTTFSTGHVVRNKALSVDRYYGPCSLFTLCKEFHDDPGFVAETPGSMVDQDGSIGALLQQMCADARREDHLEMSSGTAVTCLPPRQLLTIVAGQFFKNADYATDIFVHSHFQMELDRIYASSLDPADEAWAACFNAIVLLAIGKDHSGHGAGPFAQPFFQTLGMATNNPRVFMVPRLVNVQALALLSHAAEQYGTPGLAETVFAQACLLARMMGLHQPQAVTEGFTHEELVERHKVFRSLYIRDKNGVICRGSTSWIPSSDSHISLSLPRSGEQEDRYVARVELANIQDEVYRHVLVTKPQTSASSEYLPARSTLGEKLDRWSTRHNIIKASPRSIDEASLMLSFLATRLCIVRGSSDQRLQSQALKDAKASCFIFLQATTSHPDPALKEKLNQILERSGSSSHLAEEDCLDLSVEEDKDSDVSSAAVQRLTASLPLVAIFLIAKGILQPITEEDDGLSRTEEEISTLEALRDRYIAEIEQNQGETFIHKLSRTLDTLVKVIRRRQYAESVTTPSMIFNELGSVQSNNSSRKNTPSNLNGPSTEDFPHPYSSTPAPNHDAGSKSALFPSFLQPFGSPESTLNHDQNTGFGSWPESYQQQDDFSGRANKRRRLCSQPDLFDVTAALNERREEDPFDMIDFWGSSENDITVFNVNQGF